ncbi:hypothetical protein [Streptacidiphilus jiangxiensis]|uniref:Uncharacterized protein n=1 Tax=Streptacidiphilus jiangxiensis TaxID=235985 RepID=A0A1H7PPI1_STRJI|nr:hypothetical protein [Streptacidiphilus jiangxiensis]SEL37741.1 hypothetical protein SAMN05414137_10861 [Streptacidiphilus jiangxiensis]
MRIRIVAPALVGALALGTVALPASAFAATPKPVITHASATTLVLGLTGKATESIRITATDPAGIKSIKAVPYSAYATAHGYKVTLSDFAKVSALPVISRSATGETAGESDTETYNVKTMQLPNGVAGMVFDVAVLVTGKDGRTTLDAKATSFALFKRADALTAKPSATAVHKGASLTVKGQLNRADWSRFTWGGYAGRWVALQFRAAGSQQWTFVRWVRTGSTGALSTTLHDNRSGSWRYVYGGDAASGAATSAATWVAVK